MVDGDKVEMQFACLPAVVVTIVMGMVEVRVVPGVMQIDPGEF